MASSGVQPRLQQVADSPIASLPTEMLAQIFALAMEGPRAALVLRTFSLVCKHWYDVACAAGLEQDLFVANSKQAGRLAEALLGSPAKRQAMQSLVINVENGTENKERGRSQHVADLLLGCPNLKRLTLTIAESLGWAGTWAPFGKPLALALQALDTLESFELSAPPRRSVNVSTMYPILSGMINLRSFLTAPTTSFRTTWNSLGNRQYSLPAKLETIGILNGPLEMANALTQASASTITTILAGSATQYQLNSTSGQAGVPSQSMLQNLDQVASRLIELELLDPYSSLGTFSSHLAPLVRKLSSIRRLTLCFQGITPAERFPIFATLKTLEHLTLVKHQERPADEWLVHHQAVLDFLTESIKLKSLTLPRSHCRSWNDASRKLVEKAAEDSGVAFKLA